MAPTTVVDGEPAPPTFARGSDVHDLDGMLAEYLLDIEVAARDAREIVHVLLVEPREPTQSVLGEMLEMAGYRVRVATCVRESIRTLVQHPIDVVVTDDDLPDGSGHTLRTAIAASHPATAVLVLSDDPVLTATWAPHDLATVGLIEKPVRGLVLLAAIRAAVEARRP